MSKQTLWLLLACFAVSIFAARHRLLNSHLHPASPVSPPAATVPASHAAVDARLPLETVPPVTVVSSAPEWEQKFWDAAQHPDWEQGEYLEEIPGSIADDQIRGTLDRLLPEHCNASQMLIEMLAEHWSANSPADAAQWIEQLPDDEFGRRVFSKVARQWAEQDLAAVTNWLQQIPQSGNKTAAEMAVCFAAASQRQPDVALALAATLPADSERDSVVDYAAQQWAVTDAESAAIWASKIPDPGLREKILGKIAVNLGAAEPERGAAFIAANLAPGEIRDAAVASVVRFWASSAADDAGAWIEQFPDGMLQTLATKNLIDVWGKNDFQAASVWADHLRDGPGRDAAVKALYLHGSN